MWEGLGDSVHPDATVSAPEVEAAGHGVHLPVYGRLMRLLTAVLFASLALAACADDDGGGDDGLTAAEVSDMVEAVDGAPACDELYAEGNVLTVSQWKEPCTTESGEATFVPTQSETCADGSKLYWNDRGWWFEGEAVAVGSVPSSARSGCSG